MHIKAATLLLAIAVFAERDLGHERQVVLKKVHHHRHVGRKGIVYNEGDERKRIDKINEPDRKNHVHLSSKSSNSRKKKHFKLSMEEVDKILAIKNNNDFANKVFQMMKKDDSDVLKDIDEDEDPMIFSVMQKGLNRMKSKFNKRRSSSRKKKIAESFKRSFVMQPPFDLSNWNTGFDNQNIHQSPESSQTSQTPPPLQAGQSQNSMLTHESPQSPQSQVSQPQGSTQSQQIPHSVPLVNKTVSEPVVNDNSVEMISKQVDLVRASRVCKPGPPLASNKRLPNCLLIGDSITLGSSYSVAAALETKYTVQMSPFSKGGCALDSRYGLECIQFLLSTTNLTPTRYDVIVFNFGMHDIDFSSLFPEEFNDDKSYKKNLGRIKKILLKTGAAVAFSLTTPVTYNKTKNDMVIMYNKIAKRVMSKKPEVDVIDLYNFVIDNCGEVPFKNCYMMKKPKDVHYGLAGSILLGKLIAAKIAEMLKERNLWVKSGYSLPDNTNFTKPLFTDLKENSIKCSANATVPTRCPSETTCIENAISRSGYACCLLENAVDCKDNFHCCPENTICHKNCSPTWCSCVAK